MKYQLLNKLAIRLYIWVHTNLYMTMTLKTVALSLDEKIYEQYKKHYEANSIILFRKIESFLKEELEKNKRGVKK